MFDEVKSLEFIDGVSIITDDLGGRWMAYIKLSAVDGKLFDAAGNLYLYSREGKYIIKNSSQDLHLLTRFDNNLAQTPLAAYMKKHENDDIEYIGDYLLNYTESAIVRKREIDQSIEYVPITYNLKNSIESCILNTLYYNYYVNFIIPIAYIDNKKIEDFATLMITANGTYVTLDRRNRLKRAIIEEVDDPRLNNLGLVLKSSALTFVGMPRHKLLVITFKCISGCRWECRCCKCLTYFALANGIKYIVETDGIYEIHMCSGEIKLAYISQEENKDQLIDRNYNPVLKSVCGQISIKFYNREKFVVRSERISLDTIELKFTNHRVYVQNKVYVKNNRSYHIDDKLLEIDGEFFSVLENGNNLYRKIGNFTKVVKMCGINYLQAENGEFIAAHNVLNWKYQYHLTYVRTPHDMDRRLFVYNHHIEIERDHYLIRFYGKHYKMHKHGSVLIPVYDIPAAVKTEILRIENPKFLLGYVAFLKLNKHSCGFLDRNDITSFRAIDDWSVEVTFYGNIGPIVCYLDYAGRLIDSKLRIISDFKETPDMLDLENKFVLYSKGGKYNRYSLILNNGIELVLEDHIESIWSINTFVNKSNEFIVKVEENASAAYVKKAAKFTKPALH